MLQLNDAHMPLIFVKESIFHGLEHIAQKLREDRRMKHESAKKNSMEEKIKTKGKAHLIH